VYMIDTNRSAVHYVLQTGCVHLGDDVVIQEPVLNSFFTNQALVLLWKWFFDIFDIHLGDHFVTFTSVGLFVVFSVENVRRYCQFHITEKVHFTFTRQ